MKKTKRQQLDKLYIKVSSAVSALEQAQQKVAGLEEKITWLTKPDTLAGEVTRRRAVRAALAGRDEKWAENMVHRFCAEKNASRKLKESLRALLKQQ